MKEPVKRIKPKYYFVRGLGIVIRVDNPRHRIRIFGEVSREWLPYPYRFTFKKLRTNFRVVKLPDDKYIIKSGRINARIRMDLPRPMPRLRY